MSSPTICLFASDELADVQYFVAVALLPEREYTNLFHNCQCFAPGLSFRVVARSSTRLLTDFPISLQASLSVGSTTRRMLSACRPRNGRSPSVRSETLKWRSKFVWRRKSR